LGAVGGPLWIHSVLQGSMQGWAAGYGYESAERRQVER
jgi:hypothetical protein